MNAHNPEPLDEATRELLRAERSAPGAPSGARTRVASRLEASIAIHLTGSVPQAEMEATGSPTPVVHATAFKIGVVALAFLAGGVTGVAVDRWITRAAAHEVVPPPTAILPAAPASATPPDSAPSATAAPMPPPVPKTTSAATSADRDLGAERALLDRARVALASGDFAATLVVVNLHARRFPNGRLEEEREALAIKALAGDGKAEEARARGARFHARFPKSFLSTAVDEALDAIP